MHRTLLAATLAAALFSTTPVLEPLWRFLGTLWAEEGCRIDPSGHCLPVAQVDEGCRIDPNGRCASAATQADTGCRLDPNGRCGA